jgi:DNA repair protein RadD
MVGRGFRLHPSKEQGLILDFGGNILRHGPVDAMQVADRKPGNGDASGAPAKECPKCQAVIHAAYATCPECGFVFPLRGSQREPHERQASTAGVLSGEVTETEYEVQGAYYSAHVKRGAPEGHPRTLRVDYRIGFNDHQSEWVCVEHPLGSYARQKAEAWWRARSSEPCPTNADDAVVLAQAGVLAQVTAITVRSVAGEKFDRIVNYQLGDIPQSVIFGDLARPEPDYVPIPDEDIPF